MFKSIAESDDEWLWARARAMIAVQVKYNICHGAVNGALSDYVLTKRSNNNVVECFADPLVERYILRAAGVLGSYDSRRDRESVPQVKLKMSYNCSKEYI